MWRNTAIYHGWFLLLVPFLRRSEFAQAVSSNYNTYQYDMTGAQFTPDGRLLQVEYASAAADHSSPVVVVPIDSDLCLVCTTRRENTERLVLVPTGSVARTTAMRESHSPQPVVVALSGILADNMALLEVVQEKRLEHIQLYETPLSAQQVAQAIADQCQRSAFGGGIRPFGATLLVCGTEGIYQTDPSGAIMETSYQNLLEQKIEKSVVVGGATHRARSLKRRIGSAFASNNAVHVRKRIKEILSIVRNEQKMTEKEEEWMKLEVVLISKSRGVLKMSADQIASLEK